MKTWFDTIQNVYDNLNEFVMYNRVFKLVDKINESINDSFPDMVKYFDAEDVWNNNPVIGGSTDPDDFGIPTLWEMAEILLPHYLDAVEFTEGDESWENSDFSVDAKEKALKDLKYFLDVVNIHYGMNRIFSQHFSDRFFAHDFWLTRNHHGTGFWDREEIWKDCQEVLTQLAQKQGEVSAYSLDGLIYFE